MNEPEPDAQEKKRELCGDILACAASLSAIIKLRCPDCDEKTKALEHIAQAVTLAKEAIEAGEQ